MSESPLDGLSDTSLIRTWAFGEDFRAIWPDGEPSCGTYEGSPKKPQRLARNPNALILFNRDSRCSRYVRLWVVKGISVSSGRNGALGRGDETASGKPNRRKSAH